MSKKGWLLFAAMSVIWGIPYLLIKVADAGVSSPVLVFARTALGALVLLPAALRSGGLRALRGHWHWLAAFAAAEVLGPWWLLSDAERRLPSSLTGLLIAAVPIVGALLARFTGGAAHERERIGAKRWAGMLIGLAGVALLVLPDLLHGAGGAGGDLRALGEVLLVIIGYSIGPLIAARKLREVPDLPMSAACLGLAALVYTPFAAATWPARLPSTGVLAALATLGVLCTALAFLLFFALIREVGASRATVFTYVNPAIAVAAGVLLLGEPLSPGMLAAFVLILGGSVLATARAPRRSPGSAEVLRNAPADREQSPAETRSPHC